MESTTGVPTEALLAHTGFIRGLALALLGPDARVDDVVQDAFATALLKRPREPGLLRRWLGGVTRNLVYAGHRSEANRRRRESVAARDEGVVSTARIAIREEARRDVVRALLGLREPYRTALVLRYYEDLPPREIGRRIGVPAETARTRVKRGVAMLRERLDDRHGGGRWRAGLFPYLGASVMSTKTKVAFTVGILIVLLSAGAAIRSSFRGEEGPPGAREEAPPPVKAADAGEGGAPAIPGREAPAEADPPPVEDAPAAAPEPVRYERSGTVVAEDGQVPLEGVEIVFEYDLARSPSPAPGKADLVRRAKTDAAGRFRLEGLKPGIWSARIRHPEYAPRRLTGIRIEGEGEPFALTLPSLDAQVGGISGRVTDATGAPEAGRHVIVYPPQQGDRVYARTDADGRFRVGRLLPGFYLVTVMEEGRDGRLRRTRGVSVVPGKDAEIDFSGSGALSGTVRDETGAPLAGVRVQVQPAVPTRGMKVSQAMTEKNGRFRIENAGIGPSFVNVRRGQSMNAMAKRDLSGYDEEIEIRMVGATLGGTVKVADTGEPPRVAGYFPIVILFRYEPGAEVSSPWRAAHGYVSREGTFRITALAEGRYRIKLLAQGCRTLVSEVTLAREEKREGFELVLTPKRPGTLRITLREEDGSPADGVAIRYIRPDGNWRSVLCDHPAPGVYESRTLETGTWTIVLIRKDIEEKRIEVRVAEGETTEVEETVRKKR